jgi:hypothetical protein
VKSTVHEIDCLAVRTTILILAIDHPLDFFRHKPTHRYATLYRENAGFPNRLGIELNR